MESINDRFRELRKTFGKSQEEFGKILGITKSGVSDIENGRRNVTEQHLIMIHNASEWNVNMDWLKTGNGDMFIPRTRNQIITDFMGNLIVDEEESFRRRLIEALAQLDPEEWEILRKVAENATKKG